MKQVRNNKYVTTSAVWEQLNIFFIICKYIIFIPAQSLQHNAETKFCWALLQRWFADLENIWGLIQDSVNEMRLITCWSAPCYYVYLHNNGIFCLTIGYRTSYRIILQHVKVFWDRPGTDKIFQCKLKHKRERNFVCNLSLGVLKKNMKFRV